MNYFKSETGEVFAYDDDQIEIGLAEDKAAMTPDEVEAHLNPAPVPLTVEQVENARLQACAHPLTGSDRYFAEAQRRDAIGDTAGADLARIAGANRYEQIKAEFPWPPTDHQ